jgi:predicted aspartyl protease
MADAQRLVSTNYPYLTIRLSMRGWNGRADALADTGFDGALVAPSSLLPQIPGVGDDMISMQVANGRFLDIPVYYGSVELSRFANILNVPVAFMADQFVVGRRILDQFQVTFDHGQRLIIER